MGWSILVGLVVILVVIGVVAYFVTIYNSLVRLRNDIDKAWSNIDVLLKQRHDELPKLIETCRGYMEYEQQTLRLVTEARSAYQKASTVPEKAQADNVLTGALKTLFAVAENYPDLKASEQYKNLMTQLEGTENRIGVARQDYNQVVADYNTSRGRFPSVIFSNLFGFGPEQEFKADPAKRQVPGVKF